MIYWFTGQPAHGKTVLANMLKEKLQELISACFTGIWIETHEHHEAISEIQQLCQEEGWQMATWDIDRGLIAASGDNLMDATDPLAAIRE